jgi:GMP synthase (glutamine-hydrolysing)
MILIVDLCWKEESLSRYEFVSPIEGIVRRAGFPTVTRHFAGIEEGDLDGVSAVILCGTALQDNRFAEDLERFAWLRPCTVPVLGICAGMQAVAAAFGGRIEPDLRIGMTDVSVLRPDGIFAGKELFPAYELHAFAVAPPACFEVLAVSGRGVQAVRHVSRPVYGVIFHPEVRNEWVVTRFLEEHAGPAS